MTYSVLVLFIVFITLFNDLVVARKGLPRCNAVDIDEEHGHCFCITDQSGQSCEKKINKCDKGSKPRCRLDCKSNECDCECSQKAEEKEKNTDLTNAMYSACGMCKNLQNALGVDQKYSLTIFVEKSAVNNLREQGLDIAIWKGFSSGENSDTLTLNTVWVKVPNGELQSGRFILEWRQVNKAFFTSTVTEDAVIKTQIDISSDEFSTGQYVGYDGIDWSDPITNVSSPNVQIGYWVPTNSMHTVLLSPQIDSETDEEIWAPYFYDKFEIANGALTGYPEVTLAAALKREVVGGTFTGQVGGANLKIKYGTKTDATICVFSAPQETSVSLKSGAC